MKINTPTNHVHRQLIDSENVENFQESNETTGSFAAFSDSDAAMEIEKISVTTESERLMVIVHRLSELLPSVTKRFVDNHRVDDWVSFFSLVDEGRFEVNHIASQLFWDVVKFNDLKTVHGIRFTPEVKEFWAVGMALFHAKFIRFMGGIKSQGMISKGLSKKSLTPDASKVNFVCPDIKALSEEKKLLNIECEKPGIIAGNISAVANIPDSANKAYKMCIDGKRSQRGLEKTLER